MPEALCKAEWNVCKARNGTNLAKDNERQNANLKIYNNINISDFSEHGLYIVNTIWLHAVLCHYLLSLQ